MKLSLLMVAGVGDSTVVQIRSDDGKVSLNFECDELEMQDSRPRRLKRKQKPDTE